MKLSGGPKMGREGFPRELEQPMLGHGTREQLVAERFGARDRPGGAVNGVSARLRMAPPMRQI